MSGYRIIRTETLAWLLERHRGNPDEAEMTPDVAFDLGLAVVDLDAPVAGDRLAASGPILAADEHGELLAEQLDLPRNKQDGQFWRLVIQIVHGMLSNEAEAVLRVIAERRNAK